MTYVYLYLIVIFISILANKTTYKKESIIIIFIILILFSGFRENVGIDYQSYKNIFTEIERTGTSYKGLEIGFIFLNKLIIFFHGTSQLLFLVMSIMSNIFFYKFLSSRKETVVLSVNIFFLIGAYYISGFNGVRQYLTVGIFLYSTKYIERSSFSQYVFWIVLGSFFHNSILFMLPFYFIFRFKRLSWLIQTMIILAIGIGTVKFTEIIMYIPKYSKYFSRQYSFTTSYLILLVFLFITIVMLIYNKEVNINCIEYNVLIFNIYFLEIIFINKFFNEGLNLGVMRLYQYFYFYYIVLIPKFLKFFSNKYILGKYNIGRIVVIIFFIGSSFLYMRTTLIRLEPYRYNFKLFK